MAAWHVHRGSIIVFTFGYLPTFSYDLGPLALDVDVTSSIDALVADDDAVLPSPDNQNQVSRSSTPAVPPGFSLPHAHPPTAIREEPVTKVPTRFTPTSAPFTPARNPAIPRVATPLSMVTAPQTTQSIPKSKTSVSTSPAKQDVTALATNTGLSKAIAFQSSQPAIQSEDFPALESGKAKVQAAPSVSSKTSTQPKPAVTTTSKKPSIVPVTASQAQAVSKAAEKHSTPAPNASMPTKSIVKTLVIETSTSTPAPVKSLPPSDYPSLPSASTVASFQSPPPRPAMKSIRVVPTTKTEIPSAGSATPSSATSMFPPALPSRQASLALRPSTPSSEIISDNASITSASISRASSPPPSKIGSAPVRENTKAATRRLRKEKAEAKEKADAEARAKMAEPTPEVAIAPIMGRKKKQKKERTVPSAAEGSTPVVSRPPSPGPTEAIPDEPKPKPIVLEQAGQAPQKQSSTAEQETTRIYSKGQDSKGKGKAKAQPAVSPEPTPPAPEVENEQADKPIPTPASVFHHLIAEGLIDDVDHLFLLKNPIVNHQVKTPIDPQSINPKVTISPEDRQTLLAGEPVIKVGDGPSRIVLTPNGDCIRNLTPEEEQRYLDLQARIASDYGPASFTSAKHHSGNGFALIGGRAVSNGTPTFFPASSTGAPAMDPVSKIQRDEALGYINQYVLPSMSTNQQIEKALNVKPNETDITHAGDAAAWTNWGSDGNSNSNRRPDNGAESGYGPAPTNREGMIANGLESMTAHITIGGDLPRAPSGQPLGSVALLTLTEAEGAMQIARKETEGLEKRLNALIKKNRRLLLPSSH
ncbi:uncharacterized protein L3040_000192 [Drepanopeziza brunnea f. sp. 'multigermtubi']|uniref:General negative regulator of transcription subunit 4 n=1 Tax=Marssonina brunnea f. sp. multigermtubi (strain MB_m1) TaxID=1072389 RepID=K1XQ59_MARBU|nr:general negative regulator of transcription subunit 4 [Drepanopeziza brunnea f. sp. 'multigermtubi' MB_m1]EKD14669.1 general negative regulator of transcription subunit 4 [Drepanopeziza brunnea f. sp. 'multigermtubi' MB_m1]KAJ5053902.1 hypothetical protein L3040_000192 [Drepanopeziza brunnea f. sp. 'multigermtubi']